MDWLYGVIGFLVVAAALTFYSWTKRKQSWSGEVTSVKTKTQTDQDGNFTEDYLVIKIKLDSGKRIKNKFPKHWFLNKFPNGVHVGDRIVKESGEDMFHINSAVPEHN